MKRFLFALFRLLSSYGLAGIILVLLTLLTYLGTLAQVEMGLYAAVQRYFASWIVLHPLPGGLIVPLPGVALLLVLLSINILLGAMIRLRRDPSSIGLFVVHGGILFMLAGGLATWWFGIEGQMTLAEGQTSSRFQSYHTWELAVTDTSPEGKNIEFTIPEATLKGVQNGGSPLAIDLGLPFSIRAERYYVNANVMPKGPNFEAPTPVVDGFFIQPLARDPQIERNMPALYANLIDAGTGAATPEILWGNSVQPLAVSYGGRTFTLELRHTTWNLPFALRLEKFTREFHPNTRQPRKFASDVVRIEDGSERPVHIRMNEPLRSEGYVFFQASYIEDPNTGRMMSTLAVTKNPSDQWPLYACIIITAGMLLHFGVRLTGYLRRERESAS
jgi:hypothetical protein